VHGCPMGCPTGLDHAPRGGPNGGMTGFERRGAGSVRSSHAAVSGAPTRPTERAAHPTSPLSTVVSLQRAVGNSVLAPLLATPAQPGWTAGTPWVQRTPATWAASPTVATVAGYAGSATYWQPLQAYVAQYGGLPAADLATQRLTLDHLAAAIAAWRAHQARGLWTSTLDAQKEAALVAVETLMRAEVGRLEAAQTTVDLGQRLVALFTGSPRPEEGLVVAAGVPEDRLRAALQAPAHLAAVNTVLTRNPGAGLPARLATVRGFLQTLAAEISAPTTTGVTASSPERARRVEHILTPPATRSARAAAAAAGGPAPAFVPASYYEHLATALHTEMMGNWAWAGPMDVRAGLDTTAGGHVEGIAAEAKLRVDALYGMFGSAAAPSMTFSAGTLEDRGTIVGDPYDMARWMVREGGGGSAVGTVQEAHHSFEDAAAARVIEDRLIDHYSNRSVPTAANEVAAMAATGVAAAERERRLRVIDRMWPGVQTRGRVSVAARQGASAAETRGIYWGLFKTMIHEYLHTTAHANYNAWYRRLRDSHHVTTYQEGFTDLFTLRTWQSLFPQEITANAALRARVQGPADTALDLAAVGGAPSHYPELAEAQQLEAEFGAANMKAAYFRGNTAVLGGGRLPRR